MIVNLHINITILEIILHDDITEKCASSHY